MSNAVRAQLAAELARKRAVFVVGSGVTIAATGNPDLGWIGLVHSGIRRAVDINPSLAGLWEDKHLDLSNSRDMRDLLSVANAVKRELTDLPGAQYANWLADTVGVVRVRADAALPQLLGSFGVPIATTNYDDVLSVATGRTPVSWDSPRLWQTEFRDPGRHVMHLHGHWQHPETVIFGYEDYARVVGDRISQELVRGFSILSQIIVVGMGDGLRDPNFHGLGSWLASIARDNDRPPVVLVRDSELEGAQRYGSQVGFLAVSYGADYEDLELYLSDLLAETHGSLAHEAVVLDWQVLSNKLRRLARRIEKDYKPDFVLSMSGPGSFASALCLTQWDRDPPLLSAVTFPKLPAPSALANAYREVAARGDWILIETSRWLIHVPNTIRHFPAGSRALILDDRVIGGTSQSKSRDLLEELGYEVRTAALVVSPKSKVHVDYYEEEIDGDFVFPWGGRYGRNEPPVR